METALRDALRRDLPRVTAVAALLVVIALLASIRRVADVALAALVVAVEIGAVLALGRALGIHLHAYDALVLPALFGITIDEGVFLLERARREGVERALYSEGAAIAATALTTSAGFAALLVCRFEPLRDLGALGALGSAIGLIAAVLIVPAGVRLTSRGRATPQC